MIVAIILAVLSIALILAALLGIAFIEVMDVLAPILICLLCGLGVWVIYRVFCSLNSLNKNKKDEQIFKEKYGKYLSVYHRRIKELLAEMPPDALNLAYSTYKGWYIAFDDTFMYYFTYDRDALFILYSKGNNVDIPWSISHAMEELKIEKVKKKDIMWDISTFYTGCELTVYTIVPNTQTRYYVKRDKIVMDFKIVENNLYVLLYRYFIKHIPDRLGKDFRNPNLPSL
jgi:hypothetical protein